MAKTAAPYLHPRLSAVAYSGPEGGPIEMTIEDKRAAALAILESTFDKVAPAVATALAILDSAATGKGKRDANGG